MDVVCFETLMKTKNWNKSSSGIAPDKNSFVVLDICFRKNTRTIFISSVEVEQLLVENFENWYGEKTKGFVY